MCGKEAGVITGFYVWDVVSMRGGRIGREVTLVERMKAKAEFSRGALHFYCG